MSKSAISAKSAKIYICDICTIKCSKKNDYDRHILTSKHKRNVAGNKEPANNIFTCGNCNKEYKSRKGLWGHKKTCIKINNNHQINNIELKIIDDDNEPEVVTDSSNNDMIQVLIKENSDFKSIIMEMLKSNSDLVKSNTDIQKQNHDIQKQMLELCKNNNNTTINATDNSNNSKNFNLNVFLNEKCKDAMNLDDFANSIELKLSDLIRVGEEGYIPGMSKVIIEWLKDTEVCKRPIHCTDEKREAIQVKIANKWEKEAITSEKLMNAVRIVEKKQFDMITTFRDTYPECMNSESHHNDMLIKLFKNLSNSREPEFIKVMKRVAKSVVLNKEENN
jgi:hypothetical protein